MSEKCIVLNCENHKHQGKFVGDLCAPCHGWITKREGIFSQAYRNEYDNVMGCQIVEAEFGRNEVTVKMLGDSWRVGAGLYCLREFKGAA